jgi:hypothetical protein
MFPAQMSNELPPDLRRLGDELTSAAARTAAAARLRREGRRRLAVTAAIGALAFATLTPAALGPAHHDVRLPALPAEGFGPPGCDHPRGAHFTLPACESAVVFHRPYAAVALHRPYAWR